MVCCNRRKLSSSWSMVFQFFKLSKKNSRETIRRKLSFLRGLLAMLSALPIAIVAMACCFMRVDALARLRRTCKTLHDDFVAAWHNALFVPDGAWYELKDVALVARYILSTLT